MVADKIDNNDIKRMRLKTDPRVAARAIDAQVFAVSPHSWQLHRFSEVASRIWELAEQQCTVAQVIEKVVEEYDVDPSIAEKDCLEFISELKEKGLVELTAS